MTVQVELGDLEHVMDRLIETGRFNSRAEVLEEGVRLLEQQERFLADEKDGIEEGLADLRAGRVMSTEDVRAELLKEFSIND